MKKQYQKPEILSETLEQTSLACNAAINQMFARGDCMPANVFAPGTIGGCEVNVAKGGHFGTSQTCDYPTTEEETVPLS